MFLALALTNLKMLQARKGNRSLSDTQSLVLQINLLQAQEHTPKANSLNILRPLALK